MIMGKDVQIKFEIKNFCEIVRKLNDLEFVFLGGVKEVITRYDFENNSLSKSGIFLRIKTGFENILTIKEKK